MPFLGPAFFHVQVGLIQQPFHRLDDYIASMSKKGIRNKNRRQTQGITCTAYQNRCTQEVSRVTECVFMSYLVRVYV